MPPPPLPTLRCYFSPKGGCEAAILAEIKAAKKEILVQAYSFTADPITYALADALVRGVAVEVILDKSNEGESYSDLRILQAKGLLPLIDPVHAIAHNKIMIIDSDVVIMGSFNFTNQAELHNAENLLVIRSSPALAAAYRQNFLNHKAHSRPPLAAGPASTGSRRAA